MRRRSIKNTKTGTKTRTRSIGSTNIVKKIEAKTNKRIKRKKKAGITILMLILQRNTMKRLTNFRLVHLICSREKSVLEVLTCCDIIQLFWLCQQLSWNFHLYSANDAVNYLLNMMLAFSKGCFTYYLKMSQKCTSIIKPFYSIWLQKRKHDGDDDLNDAHKHKKSKVIKGEAFSPDKLWIFYSNLFSINFLLSIASHSLLFIL